MANNIKANGSLEKNKERVFIYLKMGIDMKEGGKKEKEKDKELMFGCEADNILANGEKGE